MAKTYTQLKADIGTFLNRADLAAAIPTFIALAEGSLNDRVRHRKGQKIDTTIALVAGEDTITLPADYEEAEVISVGGERLQFLAPAEFEDLRSSGQPISESFYTHAGTTLLVCPTFNSDVTGRLVYYASIPALSDSVQSNWLLDARYDAYLYGALIHSAPLLNEDPRVQLWTGLYEKALSELNAASEKTQTSGAPLVRRGSTFG